MNVLDFVSEMDHTKMQIHRTNNTKKPMTCIFFSLVLTTMTMSIVADAAAATHKMAPVGRFSFR